MAEWTPEAREYLDGYLRQVGVLARQQGDDADEIVAELRGHIEREAEDAAGDMVTVEMLRKTLAAIGTPEQVTGVETPLAPPWRTAQPAVVNEIPSSQPSPLSPIKAETPQRTSAWDLLARVATIVVMAWLAWIAFMIMTGAIVGLRSGRDLYPALLLPVALVAIVVFLYVAARQIPGLRQPRTTLEGSHPREETGPTKSPFPTLSIKTEPPQQRPTRLFVGKIATMTVLAGLAGIVYVLMVEGVATVPNSKGTELALAVLATILSVMVLLYVAMRQIPSSPRASVQVSVTQPTAPSVSRAIVVAVALGMLFAVTIWVLMWMVRGPLTREPLTAAHGRGVWAAFPIIALVGLPTTVILGYTAAKVVRAQSGDHLMRIHVFVVLAICVLGTVLVALFTT